MANSISYLIGLSKDHVLSLCFRVVRDTCAGCIHTIIAQLSICLRIAECFVVEASPCFAIVRLFEQLFVVRNVACYRSGLFAVNWFHALDDKPLLG